MRHLALPLVAPAPAFRAVFAGALLLAGAAVRAQDATAEQTQEESALVETLVVTATRTERPLREVAANVSVTTSEEMEAQLASDIADLVRFMPGVSAAGNGSRFGLAGFSIRGIGGNRVVTMVDGVRVADQFAFGPFLNARRDFVDVESLARAEIVRGPISSLYGSDALGGVVALTTKGPHDYLAADRPFAAGLKGGYAGADGGAVGTLSVAGKTGPLGGALLSTRRSANETENRGSRGGTGPQREQADPQSIEQDNVTAKLAWRPSAEHELALSLERYANDTNANLLSDHGSVVFGTTVDRRSAQDSRERRRATVRYQFQGELGVADALSVTVYQQNSETVQRTRDDRTTPRRMKQSRTRDSVFEQDIRGGLAQLTKNLRTGSATHRLTYGLDYYVTDNAAIRDGATFDAAGAPIREFVPLPTRDFPLTEVTHQAVFAQDEIALMGGRLLLTPGVRYDKFDAAVQADAIYRGGNPGAPVPTDYADSEATFTFGALFALRDGISTYLRYSEGFRAPGFAEVNVGNTNVIFGYKTIANPGLAAERSHGIEAGLRLRGAWGNVGLTLFRNSYRDFIEPLAIAPAFVATRGVDPADGLITFQSVNRADVSIHGWEAAAEVPLGSGFAFKAAAAYASGEDETSGKPLNSVEPLTAVFGLGYSAREGNWGADLLWTLAQGKDDSDVHIGDVGDADTTDAAPSGLDLRFAPPPGGYGVVDLLAHVDFGERTRFNAGVFNLLDKSYIRWADTIAIVTDAPRRFTQPGRNASVSLRVAF